MNLEMLQAWLSSMSADEMDSLLDIRDSDPFDSAWCNLDQQVGGDERHPDAKNIFMGISNATSQHEITSYIADDIDLIYRAKLRNVESPFLAVLKRSYAEGTVPTEVDQ